MKLEIQFSNLVNSYTEVILLKLDIVVFWNHGSNSLVHTQATFYLNSSTPNVQKMALYNTLKILQHLLQDV